MDTKYRIRDAGTDRRFYSQIPHMIDDAGLSPSAFRLYVHLKRVTGAGDNGYCSQSTSTLAKSCGFSTPTIVTAKQELLDAGLIKIEEVPSKQGGFPGHEITIVNIWEINEAMYNREEILTPDELYKKFIWDDVKNLYVTIQKIYTVLYKNFILKNNHIKNNLLRRIPEEEPILTEPVQPVLYSIDPPADLPPADPKPKKQKPAGKQSEYPTMPVMFGKLAGLCRLDPKLMAPRIGKASKELLKAGYSPEDLDKFSAWWAAEDWRGKKGQAPTIEQVKANIQRVKEQPARKEEPAIDQWSDYPADYAISTDDQFNGSLDPSRARGRR